MRKRSQTSCRLGLVKLSKAGVKQRCSLAKKGDRVCANRQGSQKATYYQERKEKGGHLENFRGLISPEAGVRGSPLAHRAEGVGANEGESGRRVGGVEEDVLAVGTRGAAGRVQRSARIGVDAADVG
jgi:hypothetical protein